MIKQANYIATAVTVTLFLALTIIYATAQEPAGPAENVDKVTYQWTDKGIKTSDGRFFELKRDNLVDKDGDPLIIIEAKPIKEGDQPSRDKMTVDQLMEDFWFRVQDQDLDTLRFVPSKFDNLGDHRLIFTSVTPSEADYLEIPNNNRYRVNIANYNKVVVPFHMLLKKQVEVSQVSIPPSYKERVNNLRSKEKP
jgi:hypothetical protein